MKKIRKISLLLVFSIVLSCIPFTAVAQSAGLFNFYKVNHFFDGKFADINSSDWFYPYVSYAYEQGLMQGNSNTTFNPYGEITLAETIALASRIHNIYNGGVNVFSPSDPWYKSYVDYALYNNIITGRYNDYEVRLTRAEFASILSRALPLSEYNRINNIAMGSLPDVHEHSEYADEIYMLYNAGILSGNDKYGTFAPFSSIERCEVSTIITRMIDVTYRKKNSFYSSYNSGEEDKRVKLNAEEISRKCASSVFYIEVYGFNGQPMSLGSGFFITEDGVAVTNYHVVANGYNFIIMTTNGKIYKDIKIIDFDKDNDVALIKVEGGPFPYLKTESYSKIAQGQTVFAIGSPEGLSNTLSQGIISNTLRRVDDIDFIQISVPISNGSSGGALINEYGNVIGIVSAGIGSDGDLNLAVPIDKAERLDINSEEDYIVWDDEFYPGFTRVLDFQHFSNMIPLDSICTKISATEEYDMYEDSYSADNLRNTLDYYTRALEECGMNQTVSTTRKIQYDTYDELVLIELDYERGKFTVKALRKPQYYDEAMLLMDFGWYLDIPKSKGPEFEDSYVVYKYKWSDYFYKDEFLAHLLVYFELLKNDGFVFLESEIDGDITYYVFEGNDYGLVFAVTDKGVGIVIDKLYYDYEYEE